MLPLARCRLLAIAVVLTFAANATAQVCRNRMQSPPGQSSQYAGSLSQSRLPTVNQFARQGYSQYGGFDQSCMSSRQRQQEQRTAQMQQRRDAEQARRQAAREKLPRPIPSDEQQAAGKFQLAHLLWQGGNTSAAQKWLDEILVKFPNTPTADRARYTLARL